MKKLLIRLAFLPFLLAIAFAVKIYLSKLWANPISTNNNIEVVEPDVNRVAVSRNIQVALLLDVSGSMDGLIEQAKAKLWRVVNEMADARYGEVSPNLEIALYIYGGDDLNIMNGYVQQLTPLTMDLDLISEKLFALRTNGGEEYCGKVISTSLEELNWSKSDEDLKMIFIAGNEPFTQGPVNFRKACTDAAAKGIFVNTIFCGDYMEGINTQWKAGADIGLGQYLNINHNEQVSYISSPYDQEISNLNDRLNQTYVYYGNQGRTLYQRQAAEDVKAESYGLENKVSRSISKSKKVYKNSTWDLVDAYNDKKVKIEEVEKETLPEEYRNLSTDTLKAKIEEKNQERTDIQEQIRKLEKDRKAYIVDKQKESAESTEQSLDEALVNTLKDQARSKNYKFE